MESALASNYNEQLRLTCSSRSPERGQVLLALLRAKVDVSSLEKRGADFRQADLRGVRFNGLILNRLDLSYAQMRGANLSEAILTNVRLQGADLRDSSIDEAYTHRLDMDQALLRVETLVRRKQGDAVGLRNSMRGAYTPQTKTSEPVEKLCEQMRYGQAALGARNRSFLIEVQTRPDGSYFKGSLTDEPIEVIYFGKVWEGRTDGFPTEVYWFDSSCKTPPAQAG